MTTDKLTRREMLKLVGAGTAGAVLAGCAAPTAPPAAPATTAPSAPTAPAVVSGKSKLVIWMENALTPEVDALHESIFKEWGAKNNVEVEFLALSISVFADKLAAAIEGGTPPDIGHLVVTRLFQWLGAGQLLPVTDLIKKLQNKGGGIIPAALTLSASKGDWWGVPYGLDLIAMHARQDLLDKAGLKYPATWDEFAVTAKALQQPPGLYGWGLPMGKDPDCDTSFLSLLWAYGGKYCNDDGSLAFKSDAMLQAIEYVAKLYKDGVIPPGATAWDGAGNNKAYQSKQVVFTVNTLSIYAWCQANDPELAAATRLYGPPAGPMGSFNSTAGYGLSIFKGSKHVDEAKSALEYFFEPERYRQVTEKANGRYMPIYKDLLYSDFYLKNPVYNTFPAQIESARFHSYSSSYTPAIGEMESTFVVPDMLNRVVVENWTPEKAMNEAYDKAAAIFEKYGK
jgi:multiple sugar transport system substrate-binding protein